MLLGIHLLPPSVPNPTLQDVDNGAVDSCLPGSEDSADAYKCVLRHYVQEHVVSIFTWRDRCAKRTLMCTRGLVELAHFFGRTRTNGTLLSHMITFLNDKVDERVCVVGWGLLLTPPLLLVPFRAVHHPPPLV